MSKSRKVLLSILVLGIAGSAAGFGVFSAFSSTTTNAGNSFAAGTVNVGSNDAGQFLYNVSNQKPGDSVTKCIKVTYSGSLDSDVHLYTPDSVGSLGQYLDMTVTPGTQPGAAFPGCTGFTPDSGATAWSGTLAQFAAAKNSYANGLSFNPGGSTKWATSDSVVYRVSLSLQDTNSAKGASTGAHSFVWEARNQ
ncbi:MAG TPA: TasA family protein [Thermoleophilaceae bacterium]